MKNFRTYDLALNLYRQSRTLNFDSGEMKDQFNRAMISVVLNLAEGSGRETTKEKRRFYTISLGSLREVQAIFDLLANETLVKASDVLGAFIYKLIQNPGVRR